MANKGAGLGSSSHQGVAMMPDGDYDIKKAVATTFDYAGTVPDGVPVIMVTYHNGADSYDQPYKAGDNAHLVPTEDGLEFIHPNGENAAIYKGGAASLFLGSLEKQGFEFTGSKVNQIEGLRVSLQGFPAPKGKSADNAKDGGKLIPLVTKILKRAGAASARPTPGSVGAGKPTPATQPSAAGVSGAALSGLVAKAILGVLVGIPEHSVKVKGLAVRCLKNCPGAKLNDITKLITPEWLAEQAETIGWTSDGETVSFEGLDQEMATALMEAI